MVLASAAGLLLDIYRDADWILAAWYGNDLVTLLIAVPMLVIGLVLVRRGSVVGVLLVPAMLAYSVYGYAYYMLGASMNVLFPLYVLLFAVPVIALILILGNMDADQVAASFSGRTPVRGVAVYMGLTGIGLAIAWLAQWAAYVLEGTVPSIGIEPFSLIAALDLSFMVPFFVWGAALLWRRQSWGYVLGAVMIVKGATYTLVLGVGSYVGGLRGIEGSAAQVPVWGLWTVLGIAAAAALFTGVRDRSVAGADASTYTLLRDER